MGDERRDFDTPGDTVDGHQDQTGPIPPHDDTQVDDTQPDGTQPVDAQVDDTQLVGAQPVGAQPVGAPDATQPIKPLGEPNNTSIMPRDSAWSGRAGVPSQGPNLRDSVPYGGAEQMLPPEQPRPWWTPVLLGLLALGLLGVVILAAWWMGRDNNPPPLESPTASVIVPTTPAEPTAQPPTTAAASPTAQAVQTVQIPRLVGMPLDDAVARLDQLGLAYRFEYRPAHEPESTILETRPGEGTVVPVQTTVTLVVSTPQKPSSSPSPSPAPAASAGPN